jgi:hypothetical protein
MAGSLLLCQQIQVSDEDLKKITGGSSLSPGDLLSASGATDTPEAAALKKQLASAIADAQAREAKAKEEAARSQRISAAIAVGSLLVAAGGLYLSWRSAHQPIHVPLEGR